MMLQKRIHLLMSVILAALTLFMMPVLAQDDVNELTSQSAHSASDKDQVDELAKQLAINPNTIAKAYRQLESEGIIVTKPGSGAFIANLDSSLSRAVRKKLLSDELERIAVEAFHMQIDRQMLLELFNNAVDKLNVPSKKLPSGVPKGGQSNE